MKGLLRRLGSGSMGPLDDRVGAFVEAFDLPGAGDGPLAGLTFGAKDLFDVAGHRTGCGNPTWAATHEPATAHARAVALCLDAGADLRGKTHTDELAYSLMGANAHYGTPVNPAAPDRLPGGSSSGSAAAVAAGLVDFALGSDTGGSVRLPASFCGLYGLRPTHGRIDVSGMVPLAPSFDAVGWFAASVWVMSSVAGVLSPGGTGAAARPRLFVAADAWSLVEPRVAEALRPVSDRLSEIVGPAKPLRLSEGPL
ncbi:MAG: amidase family protein, partial [Kiloniellaceae bacterium]